MKQNSSSRRVNEQARQVIAEILMFETSDPRLSMVTVTGCEVSFDRSVCNVYITSTPGTYDDALAALKSASGRIRSLMGKKLTWRTAPELRFFLDKSVDEAERIGRALMQERERMNAVAEETEEDEELSEESDDAMGVTEQSNATLAQIADALKLSDDFVICGHVSPDGDCIGSQLALWHALKKLGKNATCVLAKPDPIDQALMFMPGADQIIPARDFKGTARVFVGVDVPTRERVCTDACRILDKCDLSITVDHHASDTTMCEMVYVDPDSASCSMIIWELLAFLCDEVPPESALCAYTGLLTDTGGFSFQNTDKHAFESASSMVAAGIDPALASRNVFQNRTIPSLRLDALVVDRMVVSPSGFSVMSWVTEADMERLGAQKSDTEPLVNTLRSIRGIEVACMLREQDGMVRGSLRAKDDVDVAKLARKLGGGGHVAAAGFTLKMSLDEARKLLASELALLEEASASCR